MEIQMIWDLLSKMRQLRKRDGWSRQQVDTHQANALRILREHAYERSPFYHRFHRRLADAPLRELPVLTKAMVMEHFDELVTDRAIRLEEVKAHMRALTGDERFLGRYWAIATSGSSGHPGVFLFNRAEWVTALASFACAREWGGVKLDLTHRVKTATVALTSAFHMSTRVNATAHSWWMPEIRLAASEPLETIVERLAAGNADRLCLHGAHPGRQLPLEPRYRSGVLSACFQITQASLVRGGLLPVLILHAIRSETQTNEH